MFETYSCPNRFSIDFNSWLNTESTFIGGIATGQMTIVQIQPKIKYWSIQANVIGGLGIVPG